MFITALISNASDAKLSGCERLDVESLVLSSQVGLVCAKRHRKGC